MRRRQTLLAVLILSALVAAPAAAEDDWTWNAGLKGGLHLSTLDAAPDLSGVDTRGMDVPRSPLTEIDGVSAGGGLAAELWWKQLLGLEIDVQLVHRRGEESGSFAPVEGAPPVDFTAELDSTELHVPVLAKVQVVFATWRFYAGAGITITHQLSVEASSNPEVLVADDPQTDVLATVAFGVAIDAGPVEIPIELRGSTRADREPVDERLVLDGDRLILDPSWSGQGWILTGVTWRGAL